MASTHDPEPPEYLEDPEKELSIWDDDIWANNEAEARWRCRNIGISEQCRLILIQPLGRSGKR